MTYAEPNKPQTSFATTPFSFSLEKNPGLFQKLGVSVCQLQIGRRTYIPKNFFDFM